MRGLSACLWAHPAAGERALGWWTRPLGWSGTSIPDLGPQGQCKRSLAPGPPSPQPSPGILASPNPGPAKGFLLQGPASLGCPHCLSGPHVPQAESQGPTRAPRLCLLSEYTPASAGLFSCPRWRVVSPASPVTPPWCKVGVSGVCCWAGILLLRK